MTESAWANTLLAFEETPRRFSEMKRSAPMPSAKLCRESAHRTLGHLTACQASWIELIRQIRNGAVTGSVRINPDPLFRKLAFDRKPWGELLERFVQERAEWRELLQQIDLNQEIKTPRRIYTAQSLTKRMVEHEIRHLAQLPPTE